MKPDIQPASANILRPSDVETAIDFIEIRETEVDLSDVMSGDQLKQKGRKILELLVEGKVEQGGKRLFEANKYVQSVVCHYFDTAPDLIANDLTGTGIQSYLQTPEQLVKKLKTLCWTQARSIDEAALDKAQGRALYHTERARKYNQITRAQLEETHRLMGLIPNLHYRLAKIEGEKDYNIPGVKKGADGLFWYDAPNCPQPPEDSSCWAPIWHRRGCNDGGSQRERAETARTYYDALQRGREEHRKPLLFIHDGMEWLKYLQIYVEELGQEYYFRALPSSLLPWLDWPQLVQGEQTFASWVDQIGAHFNVELPP